MLDRLDDEDAEHFAEVRGLLDSAGVEYELDGTLVRGLDYYTRTVFEFESDRLGAQAALGGGGRYDGLSSELGGPDDARRAAGRPGSSGSCSRCADAEREPVDRRLHRRGRRSSASARWRSPSSCAAPGSPPTSTSPSRSIKGQMKQADRIGAATTVILDADGSRAAPRHGERRAATRSTSTASRRRRSRMSDVPGPARERATATPGAARSCPSGSARARASPAGSTAAATTAA